MKYSELEKRIRRAGCYLVGNSGHPIWFSPITGKLFETGHHKSQEVAKGTLKKIEKDSGVRIR